MLATMPGASFAGKLPPLTAAQAELAERLRSHVRHLSESIGPRNFKFYEGLKRSADWLFENLRSFGYDVERLPFEADGQVFENLHTCNDQGPFTVIGAHYDSVYECPGANDNGSAVASLLELARLLRGRQDLRFVLFTNEEPPFYKTELMGSRVYVQKLLEERQSVKNMICLETMGYYTEAPDSQKSPWADWLPSVGNFVAVCGDVRSTRIVREIVGRWQGRVDFPCLGVAPTPEIEQELLMAGMDMSDHDSFWRASIPAVMVTDTVFYRYAHYHTAEDTWEKLTYEPLARVVGGLAQVLSLPLH
ncbi:M28 family peptidase [bacterium]|nr:M28 family peptidase [bacterium]